MANTSPNLLFGPGSNDGFTPAGIAAFDNLRPAAVVRELIQNALDAARAGDTPRAVVRFRRTRMRRSDLPGIRKYASVFDKAIKTQRSLGGGSLSRQAELVVKRIQGALGQDELEVLSVLDNGIGLNEKSMNALLSDGLSIKQGGATGTYGNGHSTVIPVSDLRYVLYGGITANGRRIGAGHAVIASHQKKGEPHCQAAHGFLIRNFRAGPGALYEYATGGAVPPIIARDLDSIRETDRHGTVVIIPAFNNFLEEKSLWDMVSQAASANFFVAIEEGELKVTVEEDIPDGEPKSWTLDKITLRKVLDTHKDQRRAAAFLNGRRAFEAHRAYETGDHHRIVTSAGRIDIRLLEIDDGNTRIDLCRNGMWITDDRQIPGFQQKFADRVPFHAVLALDAQDGQDLHEYLRLAEGPLHNSIAIKRLPKRDAKACRAALREIVAWILQNTPEIQSDAYVPPDYLSLDFGDVGDEGGNGAGARRKVFWGAPVAIKRNPSRQLHFLSLDPDSEEEGEPKPPFPSPPFSDRPSPNLPSPNRTRRRPALPTIFQAASRPAGPNRRRILIECPNGCADAQLRLVPDEALDATCERPGQDPYAPAVLSNVVVNGKAVGKNELVVWEDDVVGVRLGDLAAKSSVEVETDYRLTGDFADLPNPSLRVEVFRTSRDQQGDSEPKDSR